MLYIPPEKITRLAASENENGQRGRRQSHLQALRLAQQHGWQNYLLLEDDAVILKQEKHIQVLNTLLASLAKIPWQVMILGGEISQGTMLKKFAGAGARAGLPQGMRLSGEPPLLPATGTADEQR
ncbi:putative glysosyltransferase [Escherichia coli]|uniref:Putative glysosyltransferase n=1 Tax=Escherichia coli TaxID=562 RepID=A0A376K2K5_ECOLX|nr:putative glysosyltransferase [Escherichia coli]